MRDTLWCIGAGRAVRLLLAGCAGHGPLRIPLSVGLGYSCSGARMADSAEWPRAAAEVDLVRDAMAAVRRALEAWAGNADATLDAVLRLNARDARTGLARRLDQLAPATMASAVQPCC